MNRRRKILGYGIGGFLLLFAMLYLFPYIWMTSMSFKADAEIFSGKVFPEHPTLEQYQRLFHGYHSHNPLRTLL
jgi:ABC-type glycerol-3-phosphate transport system permease component